MMPSQSKPKATPNTQRPNPQEKKSEDEEEAIELPIEENDFNAQTS